MTSTSFPCRQEFHASCIKSTSTDASKMAAVLNSRAHPHKKELIQQREHGRRQTHCEKSRHVQHFAPSFQATFQRKSSTRDKKSSMTIRKKQNSLKEADMSSQTPSSPQDEVGIGLILADHQCCMEKY